jgi:hypothetical protein
MLACCATDCRTAHLPALPVTYLYDATTRSCCDIAYVLLPHDKHDGQELHVSSGMFFVILRKSLLKTELSIAASP